MHKTKGRFPGAGHISFGDEEDETPLTHRENRGAPWSSEAMASQLEAYCQAARHQNAKPKKQREQKRSRRSPLAASWCEEEPRSAFGRLGRTPASQKRQHWSTTWYMQMSAVVVALALAALIGLTFALRHADKVRDAGRGLDVDNDDAAAGENGTSANATSHEHAAVHEGGDAAYSTGNGSRREEREPEPHPASGNTDNSGGQSKTPVYNARFSSVAHQPSMQATSPPSQHGPKGAEESAKRILLRMNRKEWLNSRGWHLA